MTLLTNSTTYNSYSEKETMDFGQKIACLLHGGDIVLLEGELGAGKTTLVKGIASGLGISDTIVSPTFTLMNVYAINTTTHKHINTLVHIDTYRLKNEQELVDIGIEDYLSAPDTVCVIEWPEKIMGLLIGKKIIYINLIYNGASNRMISIRRIDN